MAVVKKLSVQNIRSHDQKSVLLSPTTSVITGKNGSGKTSLIEALYISLQGSSFKGSDADVLKHGSDWWRIDVEFIDTNKRTVSFDPSLTSGRKKFTVDDKVFYRLPTKNKYPVVLFEPEDLRLLNGSPARRRQFIDRFISQLDPIYHNLLNKYERALKQRNNLLKQFNITNEELFVWDIALSDYGAYLIERRIVFIEKINNQLNDLYNYISKTNDLVSIHYSHTYIGDIKQKILNDLNRNLERDKIIGYTSTGPHRHDVLFQFNNSPAIDTASRGEVRSIILALKYLEVEILEQIVGEKPIILMDDVFSELDDMRQKNLLNGDNQVIITSTKLPDGITVDIKNIEL